MVQHALFLILTWYESLLVLVLTETGLGYNLQHNPFWCIFECLHH